MKHLFCAAAISLAFTGAASAATTVIDFDALSSGTDVRGIDFDGLTLSGSTPLRVTGSCPGGCSGNTVISDTPRGPVAGEFSISGVNSISVDIGDLGTDAEDLFLRAFDSAMTLIGSDSLAILNTDRGFFTLSVVAADITFIEFGSTGQFSNSVFYDNITFEADGMSAVPLPAGGLLLLGAFGALGAVRSRRKAK